MATKKATRDWRKIAKEAQTHRDRSIAAVDPSLVSYSEDASILHVNSAPSRFFKDDPADVGQLPPEELARRIREGYFTSVAVTNAYLRRAAVAQGLTNCITELLPDRALKRAAELDEYLAQHGKAIGPLHGVPISVKEHINMEGLGIDGAMCSGWGTVAEKGVHLLRILRDAGAIFYARTTQPQTIMHLETANNLYGTTVNPFNRNLTAGGSSGGEGALLGLRGSCLGIGSDIGGSIRSPAANNGLFGLKPTSKRVPDADSMIPPEGEEHILGTYGPLSTSLEGISLFMDVALSGNPWLVDPSLTPLPWRISTPFLPAKLKVAVMWDDGIVRPHPPIERALWETVDKLRASPEIEVVSWTPYKHDYAWRLIASLYFADGGEAEKEAVAETDEPWLPLSRWILTENPFVRHLDVHEIWSLQGERERYRREYAARWNETATGTDEHGMPTGMIDVILCPVGPGAAPPLHCAKYWCYTSQWNLLDYPALVVPLSTKVDVGKDRKEEGYVPKNEDDRYNYELYDPEQYRNAPLALQIVGRRNEDEKLVQAARLMSKYVNFDAAK